MRREQRRPYFSWRVAAAGVVLCLSAGSSFAEEERPIPEREIVEAFTRGSVVREKFDESGYSTPETSNYVSLQSIRFDLNSDAVRAASKRQLDEVAKALETVATRGFIVRPKPTESGAAEPVAAVAGGDAKVRLLVEGHTCDRGEADGNLDLSRRRARAVAAYLVSRGVDVTRIETRGWGETRPVAPNIDEPHRAKNRRVDFVLRRHKDTLPKPSGGEGSRGLEVSTTADRGYLAVTFEALAVSEGGRRYTNDAIDVLRAGDGVRASFRVLEGCHVQGLLLDSAGDVSWLFPASADEFSRYGLWCYVGQEQRLPEGGDYYSLDAHAGTEIFCLIATHGPLPKPDQLPGLLKRHGKALDAKALRSATGVKDAELHMLVVDHR